MTYLSPSETEPWVPYTCRSKQKVFASLDTLYEWLREQVHTDLNHL